MSSSLSAYHAVNAGPAQIAERPESHFTSRIRSVADQSNAIAIRLERVLANLRVPPPSPAQEVTKSRQASVEDHIQNVESANERIHLVLNEIENLIG